MRNTARNTSVSDRSFALARALIEARTRAHLTQAELAGAHGDDAIGGWPGWRAGRVCPSTRTLEKVAQATGTRLRIHFDPT